MAKGQVDYIQFAQEFSDKDFSEIHSFLREANNEVSEAHRFMKWGETTNDIVSFLIPYRGKLYVTVQVIDHSKGAEDRLSLIEGVANTPYELIITLEATANLLKENWLPHKRS